jgi:hypothetical protein
MSISGAVRLASVTTAALLLAAPLTTALTSSATGAVVQDGPFYGAPGAGTCTTLTLDQAAAAVDRSTVVDCSQSHTAKVAGLGRLPAGIGYGKKDAGRLYRVVAAKCHDRVAKVLGRDNATRDSSAYSYMFFVPSKAERSHGARWISCSVVLRDGHQLADLPTDQVPMLPSGSLGKGIKRCLLARTDAAYTTRCSSTHGWRTTGSFSVAGKTFPGTTVLDQKAVQHCANKVVSGRKYRWTYKLKPDWEAGKDHVVVCYSQTSS